MIPAKVIGKELVSADIAHVYLRALRIIRDPLPGQFVMLWVPGYEEVPMSVSGYSSGTLRITVKARGPTTSYVVRDMPVGTYLGIRGPLGCGLGEGVASGRGLLVAGGVGVAPLLYLISRYGDRIRDSTLVVGFSSRDEVRLVDEAVGRVGLDVVTEDEPDGLTVVDLVARRYASNASSYDYYLASGPRAVLDQVVRLMPDGLRGYVLAESLIKCGIGFCGSCAIRGFLVCRDGPLIDALKYRRLTS